MSDPASGGPTPPPNPPQRRHVLRCAVCGRPAECWPGEVFDLVAQGWPKCCGAAMSLSPEVSPDADPQI